MMRKRTWRSIAALTPLLVFYLFLILPTAGAQTAPSKRSPIKRSPRPAISNRNQIARILREIDSRNIEITIRKLVSFGTRNTLSAQDDPNRGIGAARDWLFQEFAKVAEQSNGRMTVEK